MSDYFGALLRSAGAAPAAPLARATPAVDADLVEQEVEMGASAAPEFAAAAPSPDAPAGIESPPPTEATPASPDRRDAMRTGSVRAPLTRPAFDDDVHPAVRAALEWVAADPEPVERAVSEALERRPARDSSPRRLLPHLDPQPAVPPASADALAAPITQPARTMQSRQAPPIEHEAGPSRERQAEPAPPSPAREQDLTPRPSRPRQEVVTTIDEAAPAPQERIEVNIGTIHVRVDAPPAPRAVAQPAPPPQRPPQPARSAERSSFARSRVPRV